jgi:hypothetical protein
VTGDATGHGPIASTKLDLLILDRISDRTPCHEARLTLATIIEPISEGELRASFVALAEVKQLYQ